MNDFPKRNPHARLDLLVGMCEDHESNLEKLLNESLDPISNNIEELKIYIKKVKESFKNYNQLCHEAICSLYKNGCRSQANDLKEKKREMKLEVKESVADVISMLSELGIDDTISNVPTESESNYDRQSVNENPADN